MQFIVIYKKTQDFERTLKSHLDENIRKQTDRKSTNERYKFGSV